MFRMQLQQGNAGGARLEDPDPLWMARPISFPISHKPVIAIVLQGLEVGGMERGALQLARCAWAVGYDARLVLYDKQPTRSDAQYDPEGIPVSCVLRNHGMDFTLPVRLACLFHAWNVSIVHARNNVAGLYSAAAIALMRRHTPRLIVSFDTFPGLASAKARLSSRWASRRAAKVTAVSDELSARLVATGWAGRVQTIWNGVDSTQFTPDGPALGLRQQFRLPDSGLLVGQVARLEANKRQVDLIEALNLLGDNNIALVLAGEGPCREDIERAATASAIPVRLLLRVFDVASFLRDLDIFVLCSDDEGAPRALLEAMACARAIVATAVGGVPRILGNCGLLVPPRRPGLLAQAISRLRASKDLRTHLGNSARDRVLRLFTLEQEWAEYEKIYKETSQ
jgi:glycosyltransferase involved in cell wall biosynthesis